MPDPLHPGDGDGTRFVLEDSDAMLLLEQARIHNQPTRSVSGGAGGEAGGALRGGGAASPLPFFASGMVQTSPPPPNNNDRHQEFGGDGPTTPTMSMHDRRALDILRSASSPPSTYPGGGGGYEEEEEEDSARFAEYLTSHTASRLSPFSSSPRGGYTQSPTSPVRQEERGLLNPITTQDRGSYGVYVSVRFLNYYFFVKILHI